MKKLMITLLASAVIGMAFGQTVRADSQSPPGNTLLIAKSAPENYCLLASAFAPPALAYAFYEPSPPGHPDTTIALYEATGENAPCMLLGITPTSTGPPGKTIVNYYEAKGQTMAFIPGYSGAKTTAAINFGRGGQTVVLTTFQDSGLLS